jgi:hypothetical protein
MPPRLPSPSGDQPGNIVPLSKDLTAFASLFCAESAGAAIRANEFDLQEELTMLITLMRDPDPAVKLGGHNAFRKVLKEISNAQGQASITRIRTDDGALIREHSTTSRILGALPAARAPSPFPRAQPERLGPRNVGNSLNPDQPHGSGGRVPPEPADDQT